MVASLQVFAVIWASLAGIPSSFKLSEEANETELSQASSGGGLYSFGSTVAIYNPRYSRFVQMNKGSNSMTSKPSSRIHLEMFETYERFIIVDAGGGKIGLHNSLNNRFLKMSGGSMMTSPIKAASNLPVPGWESEYFEIIDGGNGEVGLYNRHHQRFVSMSGGGVIYGSPQRGDTLPHDWYDQRFFLVPARPYLVPGSVVALYSGSNQNYLRLKEHGMDGHRPPHPPHFPSNWGWEKFKVVDAGAGRVGLYSNVWRKFVKMDGHSVTVSPWTAGDHFPHGWGAEAFVVIPILPNDNKVMLWHPGSERCVKMSGTSVQRSPHRQAQDLGTDWGSEIFTVVVLEDPPDED
mmetsp:Transcript_33947/g.79011  ORF Transcript_33947/g.79011 Transcript_33947/m.79011 type:complete len:349 (-) Transcript_33947:93-1139(-)